MATKKQNIQKTPPKGNIRFSITLSEEQKAAKQAMLHHPYNFIVGKAGSGKTLLACQVYNKPAILEKMENQEDIELVSLAHFRGRTFENCVVIVDEFQNLTRSQLRMALGRLGKGSTMIFCGDNQQIDLKDKNYSAIHDVSKLTGSEYVYKRILLDNHRHPAIDEVFEMLMGM